MGKGKKKKAAEVIKKVEAPEGKKEDAAAAKKAEGGSEDAKKKEKKKGGEGKKEEDAGRKDAEGGGRKTAEGGGGESEGDQKKEKTSPPPPPPEEIVMRVWMHCEGCARKVQRSLAGFPGVEDVKADSRTQMVVVKGKPAAADPLRVVERLQRKSGRKVELLSPIPPKPEKEEEKKGEDPPAEKPKPEQEKKKEEQPSVTEVVLKVSMHCDACSQEIKRRILKMKGVRSADTNLKTSQVTVKGVFDPTVLVEHVHKRTWRHATIIKVEHVAAKASDKDKSGQDKVVGGDGENDKTVGGDEVENAKKGEGGDDRVVENDSDAAWKDAVVMKNSYRYYHPRYQVEYTYPPQIFSDENPNACSVM